MVCRETRGVQHVVVADDEEGKGDAGKKREIEASHDTREPCMQSSVTQHFLRRHPHTLTICPSSPFTCDPLMNSCSLLIIISSLDPLFLPSIASLACISATDFSGRCSLVGITSCFTSCLTCALTTSTVPSSRDFNRRLISWLAFLPVTTCACLCGENKLPAMELITCLRERVSPVGTQVSQPMT